MEYLRSSQSTFAEITCMVLSMTYTRAIVMAVPNRNHLKRARADCDRFLMVKDAMAMTTRAARQMTCMTNCAST